MDSDTHKIYGKNLEMINSDQEVKIGDKVWIGCRTTILKGSVIPDGCVIGAGSLVTGTKFTPDSIIIGSPAKSVRTIDGWEL
jgi:acetyltransferase-like isoleucine patch superfamily enzyme